LVFGLFAFAALISMQIFANIIISLSFLILAIIGGRLKQKLITFFLCLIFILTIPSSFYSKSLFTISKIFPAELVLHEKLVDLAAYVSYKNETNNNNLIRNSGSEAEGRLARYPQLWNLFIQHPLLGINSSYIKDSGGGFHLFWMYKLTTHGIVLFLLFVLIPLRFIIFNYKTFNLAFKDYYILASISFLSYGLVKNIGGREAWYTFFIILPGMYYLPLLQRGVKSKK
jgi:hypothetical protein